MKCKILFPFFYLLIFLANAQEKSTYNYFIPEYKTPDSGSKIEINKQGDTVLVSRFQIPNSFTNSNQVLIKTYKNTPFFENKWHKGEILTDNNQVLVFVMAYNIEKGEVYLVTDPAEVAPTMRPIEFSVGGHTFKQFKKRYYETIYVGKSEILKEYQCILQLNKPTQKTGYESEGKESEFDGEFIKSVKYYLKNKDRLKGIPTGKRLFRLFDNQRKTVETYAKSRGLNPNKEAGLIEIFKYFETL